MFPNYFDTAKCDLKLKQAMNDKQRMLFFNSSWLSKINQQLKWAKTAAIIESSQQVCHCYFN